MTNNDDFANTRRHCQWCGNTVDVPCNTVASAYSCVNVLKGNQKKKETVKLSDISLREQVLDLAKLHVIGDRTSAFGRTEDSFENIRVLWSSYLDRPLTSRDVAYMMILLKIARLKKSPNNFDSLVDIAGYAACAAACEEVPEISNPVAASQPDNIK